MTYQTEFRILISFFVIYFYIFTLVQDISAWKLFGIVLVKLSQTEVWFMYSSTFWVAFSEVCVLFPSFCIWSPFNRAESTIWVKSETSVCQNTTSTVLLWWRGTALMTSNIYHDIASEFMQSNSTLQGCFIFPSCAVEMSIHTRIPLLTHPENHRPHPKLFRLLSLLLEDAVQKNPLACSSQLEVAPN